MSNEFNLKMTKIFSMVVYVFKLFLFIILNFPLPTNCCKASSLEIAILNNLQKFRF